jgi:hypothetical protein
MRLAGWAEVDTLSGTPVADRIYPAHRLAGLAVLGTPATAAIAPSTVLAEYAGLGGAARLPVECVRDAGPLPAAYGDADGSVVGLRGRQYVNRSTVEVLLLATVVQQDGATVSPRHTSAVHVANAAYSLSGGAPVPVQLSGSGPAAAINGTSLVFSLTVGAGWPFRVAAPATNLTIDLELMVHDAVRDAAGRPAEEFTPGDSAEMGPFFPAPHVHLLFRPEATAAAAAAGAAGPLAVHHRIFPSSRPGIAVLRLYYPQFTGSLTHDFAIVSMVPEVVAATSAAAPAPRPHVIAWVGILLCTSMAVAL